MKSMKKLSLGLGALLAAGSLVAPWQEIARAENDSQQQNDEITGEIVAVDRESKTITLDVGGQLVTLSYAADMSLTDQMQINQASEKQPMYGSAVHSEVPASDPNDLLIREAVKSAGSREAASQEFLRVGWARYNAGDLNAAMRRFNQAWLLDSLNADVFWAFGSVSLAEKDLDESIAMFDRAIALDSHHAKAICGLGAVYQLKAVRAGPSADAPSYLQISDQLFDQGSRLDPHEERCYSDWAVTLFLQRRYADAWHKIEEARQLGGSTISSEFLKELAVATPDYSSSYTPQAVAPMIQAPPH